MPWSVGRQCRKEREVRVGRRWRWRRVWVVIVTQWPSPLPQSPQPLLQRHWSLVVGEPPSHPSLSICRFFQTRCETSALGKCRNCIFIVIATLLWSLMNITQEPDHCEFEWVADWLDWSLSCCVASVPLLFSWAAWLLFWLAVVQRGAPRKVLERTTQITHHLLLWSNW